MSTFYSIPQKSQISMKKTKVMVPKADKYYMKTLYVKRISAKSLEKLQKLGYTVILT